MKDHISIKELATLMNISASNLGQIISYFKIATTQFKFGGVKMKFILLRDVNAYLFNSANKNTMFSDVESMKSYFIDLLEKNAAKTKSKYAKPSQKPLSEKQKKFQEEQLKKLAEIDSYSKILLEKVSEVWFKPNNTKYIIHAGPTNSGKTYNSIQALKKAPTGVYLAPLRLLAWEIYENINKDRPCNLFTGEERINNHADITSCTIEMLNYSKHYDTVVIDEAFMVGDRDRGKAWLKAILEVDAKEVHIISSLDSLQLIESILTNTDRKFKTNKYERKTPLVISDETYKMKNPLDKTVFVVFSRIKAIQTKELMDSKNLPCSILYGNLPPEVKKTQIEKFISGENKVCVSTDVIGMGVNLPCDHVVFIDVEKFDGEQVRPLNPQEVKQISGRAGRFGLSEKGTVWTLEPNNTKKISKTINKEYLTNKAYCEFSFDIIKLIDKPTLLDRINLYSELNFIPDSLKGMVYLEDKKKYWKLASHNNLEKIAKNDLELAWNLIKLPVKETSESLWYYIVNSFKNQTEIDINNYIRYDHLSIMDHTQLGSVESIIANIDLVMNILNNRKLSFILPDYNVETLHEYKYQLIDLIDKFLLDKKAFKNKSCTSCQCAIPVSSPHKMCEECYDDMISRRSKWYDDDFDSYRKYK